MTSHFDVARAWANGNKLTGSRMYTDGEVLYSFGEHFPICATIRGITLFNNEKYSSSTSKHQSIARSVCGKVVECNTKEIKNAIYNPDEAIIIKEKVYPTNIDEALSSLKNICKNSGMKRFPNKKIKDLIEQSIFLEKL